MKRVSWKPGFVNVTPIPIEITWNEITFHHTEGEPTIYIAGDTVWCSKVGDAIKIFTPDIILVNAGAASLSSGPITMTAEDVITTCEVAPSSVRVVAIHIGSHESLSLDARRAQAGSCKEKSARASINHSRWGNVYLKVH